MSMQRFEQVSTETKSEIEWIEDIPGTDCGARVTFQFRVRIEVHTGSIAEDRWALNLSYPKWDFRAEIGRNQSEFEGMTGEEMVEKLAGLAARIALQDTNADQNVRIVASVTPMTPDADDRRTFTATALYKAQ